MDKERISGVVVQINAPGWRYAIKTGYGYVIADGEAHVLRVGDQVVGWLRNHGDVTVRNRESGEDLALYVEAFDATAEGVRALLSSR